MEANLINLIMFGVTFLVWDILMDRRHFKWYTHLLAGICGFFLGQTIVGVCGHDTLISLLMK